MSFVPTIGAWGAYGASGPIDPLLVANIGLVGLQVNDKWNDLNPAPGVFDFSRTDLMISECAAHGFKVTLSGVASHYNTPKWVVDATAPSDKIFLLDPTQAHDETWCTSPATCLPWSEPFRTARFDLEAALAARYASNPTVEGKLLQFANHHSTDWNVQNLIGLINCHSNRCPGIIPGFNCISKVINPDGSCTATVNQVAQWLAAGWTEEKFVNCGKEICDYAATVWLNQRLELPIGGIADPDMAANYSSPAKALMDYIFGVDDMAGFGRPYKNRFYFTRQIFLTNWKDGTFYLANPPGMNSANFIRWMIAQRARPNGPFPRRASVQNQWGATSGPPNCDLQGGPTGSCGPTCPSACVIKACFDKVLTYNLDRIEIIEGDSKNPDLFDAIKAGTLAMGGVLRGTIRPPTRIAKLIFSQPSN